MHTHPPGDDGPGNPAPVDAPRLASSAAAPPAPSPLIVRGACYVMFAYDIGFSVDLDEAERRIATATYRETIKHRRRAPRHFAYEPAPLRVAQSVTPISIAGLRTAEAVDSVIYDFGAVSVAYRIPISGPLESLLALSNALYENEELLADSRARLDALLRAILPAVARPETSAIVEDYLLYQIEETDPPSPGAAIADAHRPLIAQILRSESQTLSQQEVDDAMSCRIAYSARDTTIIDWNAAMIIERDAEDTRAILEFANVELLELRHLDNRLDKALDGSYSALATRSWGASFRLRQPSPAMNRLAHFQVDNALLFEGVNNALKLIGDQYLARLYRLAATRLHLPEWDASILRKLSTIESIYQKMSDHQSTLRMEVLEWIIIILIAVSIVLPFIPGVYG